jgi:regulator of cell morphogenesis and NO signaling
MRAAANVGGLTIGEVMHLFAHAPDWLCACGMDPNAAETLSVPAACAAAGIDPRELAEGLSMLASEHVADSQVELDRLCRYIVLHHHVYVRRHTPHIQAALAALPASSASIAGTSLPELFAVLASDLITHLAKEENILFPAIEALAVARRAGGRAAPAAFVTLLHPIRAMEGEHARMEHALDCLRDVTGGFRCPPESVEPLGTAYRELQAFDRDFHQHVRLENELLFPRALELEHALA